MYIDKLSLVTFSTSSLSGNTVLMLEIAKFINKDGTHYLLFTLAHYVFAQSETFY